MRNSRLVLLFAAAFMSAQCFTVFAQDAPKTETKKTEEVAKTCYTCPMHKDVKLDKEGKCPKCGMALVKCEAGAKTAASASMCTGCKHMGKDGACNCKDKDSKQCTCKKGKMQKQSKTPSATPEKSEK